MTDAVMSEDPWFIDLNGSSSINLDAQAAERERFYQKIIDIGQAIRSGLQHAPHPVTTQNPAPIHSQPVTQSQPLATTSKPIPSSALSSVKRLARENTDGNARNELHSKRLRIEALLRNDVSSQRSYKHRKGAADEDIEGPEPELDIPDILLRAQILVPPVSGLFAQKRPSSESFDENDYYSSQADSIASSLQRGADDAEAESVAMAMSSEGEISEGEFEPELNPLVSGFPRPVTPNFEEVEDDVYEPNFVAEDEEDDDDYEPPAVESPPYEPNPVSHSQRQLMNAGPPLPPRAISINHIRSPVAPQPSHISPLTTANFAQQLDHSPEQSSKSDQDIILVPTKKGKGKNKKSPKGVKNANQNGGSAKKRKRGQEQENRPGRHKRRSQAEPDALIKEEPMSPPPFGLAKTNPPPAHVHPNPSRDAYNGTRNPVSQAQEDFRVPAGFKLVPIDNGFSAPAQPQYREPLLPASRPYSRPILRDDRGVEYYAYPETLPAHAITQREGPVYSERPPPAEPYQMYNPPLPEHRYNEDPYHSARPTPGPSQRYPERIQAPTAEYRQFEERHYPPPQAMTGPGASPFIRESYISSSVPAEHRPPPYGYPPAEPIHAASPYASGPYRAALHQLGPAPFEAPRPQSVHPQAYGGAYHPGIPHQPSVPPRATSVYPGVYHAQHNSGSMLPPLMRHSDGYESAPMNDARRISGRY
jgi:hypothetical protein